MAQKCDLVVRSNVPLHVEKTKAVHLKPAYAPYIFIYLRLQIGAREEI